MNATSMITKSPDRVAADYIQPLARLAMSAMWHEAHVPPAQTLRLMMTTLIKYTAFVCHEQNVRNPLTDQHKPTKRQAATMLNHFRADAKDMRPGGTWPRCCDAEDHARYEEIMNQYGAAFNGLYCYAIYSMCLSALAASSSVDSDMIDIVAGWFADAIVRAAEQCRDAGVPGAADIFADSDMMTAVDALMHSED